MAIRNRDRGNREWNESGNYGQDYNSNKGAYSGGSTYRNRGEGNWQNEGDYDESSYNGGWQRKYDEDNRDYNQNRSQFSNQGYYGNQGSRYGEYGPKNRNRENDYENTGS